MTPDSSHSSMLKDIIRNSNKKNQFMKLKQLTETAQQWTIHCVSIQEASCKDVWYLCCKINDRTTVRISNADLLFLRQTLIFQLLLTPFLSKGFAQMTNQHLGI